jgi:hypothetical protein
MQKMEHQVFLLVRLSLDIVERGMMKAHGVGMPYVMDRSVLKLLLHLLLLLVVVKMEEGMLLLLLVVGMDRLLLLNSAPYEDLLLDERGCWCVFAASAGGYRSDGLLLGKFFFFNLKVHSFCSY